MLALLAAALVTGSTALAVPATEGDRIAPVVVRMIPAQPTASSLYRTEVVCRILQETGSLFIKHKSCLTAKQWDYVDQEHRDYARHLMMDSMGKGSSH
jgi:hypothetical protein